ncbi:T9SS type A sorting domain-containing protein [Salibacteraceae bacterium]|nr:T9SS type A sorting domain-containing protein [Salibacteraceae bacterium]
MKHLLIAFFIIGSIHQSVAQTTNISGTLNQYAEVEDIHGDTIDLESTNGFSTGDKILVIQMQGAAISQSNSAQFGTISNLNGAGNYEFTEVCAIAGNSLVVTGIDRSYETNGNVQVVFVPEYNNAVVTAQITAEPWNGSTGGIIVFECAGTLTLNNNIRADGVGFRGGATSTSSYSCSWLSNLTGFYYNISTGEGAKKGEGIAKYVTGKTGGRGAQANGGGGANDHNGGGGGGANSGSGGEGGQRIKPSTFTCGCLNPGVGGKTNSYSNSANRVYLGGGGGAGHENNANTATPGANGGGIVLISAATLIANGNTISSVGNSVQGSSADGAGGAGAGGTILLDIESYTGSLNVDVSGGDGGNVANVGYSNCNGPGGGGGGGILWVSQSNLPSNITLSESGGDAGITLSTSQSNCTVNGNNYATDGDDGALVTGLEFVQTTCDTPLIEIDTTICANDSLFLAGDWRSASGIYYDTTETGCCMSILATELTVLDEKTGSITDTICRGEALIVNGNSYYSSVNGAIEVISGVGPFSCDSTVSIFLTVNEVDTTVLSSPPLLTAQASGAIYQWVSCPEYLPIADANQKEFTALEDGSFALIITENECTDTSSCYDVSTLGILVRNNSELIQVFPNPTKGTINLTKFEMNEKSSISLFNSTGQFIRKINYANGNQLEFNIIEPSGLYILCIETENMSSRIQVLKID